MYIPRGGHSSQNWRGCAAQNFKSDWHSSYTCIRCTANLPPVYFRDRSTVLHRISTTGAHLKVYLYGVSSFEGGGTLIWKWAFWRGADSNFKQKQVNVTVLTDIFGQKVRFSAYLFRQTIVFLPGLWVTQFFSIRTWGTTFLGSSPPPFRTRRSFAKTIGPAAQSETWIFFSEN